MENNLRKKLKDTKGITLIALVITIIVLLILAGVSISAVFNQGGIFNRAEQAVDKHGQAKARETLELALGEAQMQKYEEGLTDEQLDNKIGAIQGELLPKEKPEYPNLQNVIVDGYIFEIDRSVPKIVDYIGPADGVIITAVVTQNGNWQNPTATVTGTIIKYGGGTVTGSSATATNGVTIAGFPTAGGSYTIQNITTDTDITITAKDSEGHATVTRTIKVRLVRDNTPPTLSNAKAEAGSDMKIKISVTATDDISGVAQINYKITPNTVDSTTPTEGTLQSGVEKEIITTVEGEHTVTFTATDNAGNITSPGVKVNVTVIDGMTVSDVKSTVNASNIADYIGTKVIDYETGAIWRVFYIDSGTSEHPNGYFGDGAGTIYLMRDYRDDEDTKTVNPSKYKSKKPSTEAVNYMKQLNPLWRESDNGKKEVSKFLTNERMAGSFYEQSIYGSYKNDTYSTYAVGAAPIEMWTKAHSIYKNKYEPSNSTIGCGIENEYGYGYSIDGGDLTPSTKLAVADFKIEPSKCFGGAWMFLASPSSYSTSEICEVYYNVVTSTDGSSYDDVRPVVPLNR